MPEFTARSRTRIGAAAALVGATAAVAVLTGAGPVPSLLQPTSAAGEISGSCDELEHAQDAACVGSAPSSTEIDASSTTSVTSSPDAEVVPPGSVGQRTVDAGAAGSIVVGVDGSVLHLLATHPAAGWTVEVEQGTGREVEVTFRSGALRVDVNVEIEDGQVRERVRTRNDATDERTETINGVATRDDDSSGPGSGTDDDHDHDDDSSGSGSGHG